MSTVDTVSKFHSGEEEEEGEDESVVVVLTRVQSLSLINTPTKLALSACCRLETVEQLATAAKKWMSRAMRDSSGGCCWERRRSASRSVVGEEVQDGPRSRRIWGREEDMVMVVVGGWLFVWLVMVEVMSDWILVCSCWLDWQI